MIHKAKKYSFLLASALLAAAPSYASSITGFSFTPDPSIFSSALTENFSGSQAVVTGLVTCPAGGPTCNGEVGSFSVAVDLTSLTPISVDISGVLSGETPGSGSLDLTSPISKDYLFNVAAGPFDDTILSSEFPAFGSVSVDGILDLTLQAGQSIDLPLTINVGTPSSVPEPSSQVLLIVGLLGMAGIVRYRRSRTI